MFLQPIDGRADDDQGEQAQEGPTQSSELEENGRQRRPEASAEQEALAEAGANYHKTDLFADQH